MKKIKLIIFILLLFSLVIIFFFGIFGTNLSFKSLNYIKNNRSLKQNFNAEIKINNTDVLYDEKSNIYYHMVPSKFENSNYFLKFELDNKYKYKIIGKKFNIINVKYNQLIKIIIYDNKYFYEINLQLTNLPMINIETDNLITSENETAIVTYINENNNQSEIINNAKIKTRGAASQKLDKKSYRINFYNKNYTDEKKVSISNFYMGDSLILDALYRDSSKIRNLLATQLWNDISKDFTDVTIYSEFVEVFINNEYKGLYLLTEPINRTKLNLNKTNTNNSSFIVKSTLGVLEVKYPNNVTYVDEVSDMTSEIISKYFQKGTNSSYEVIKNTFDIKNYVDIIIFNYFINNFDNQLYQNVYYYNNSLNSNYIYIQPWDFEFSFGNDLYSADKFDCLIYHPNAKEINKLIIERYWELRESILTFEYFSSILDNYSNKLNKGATLRDSNKWYEYYTEQELDYIRNWIKDRIKYTDEKIKEIENE